MEVVDLIFLDDFVVCDKMWLNAGADFLLVGI